MSAIKNQLNCNSVRIYGKEPDRLILTAEAALQTGLNVWLSPGLINGNSAGILPYLKTIASSFAVLRKNYPAQETVFVTGAEDTIDASGFLPGSSIHERIDNLANPALFLKNVLGIMPEYQNSFVRFLNDAAASVKKNSQEK